MTTEAITMLLDVKKGIALDYSRVSINGSRLRLRWIVADFKCIQPEAQLTDAGG